MRQTYPANSVPLYADRWSRFVRVLDRRDSEGAYRDFATDAVFGQVRQSPNADDVIATFDADVIAHPDGHGDTHALEIALSASALGGMPPGRYHYSVMITPATGIDDTFLLIAGELYVRANPTDPTEAP